MTDPGLTTGPTPHQIEGRPVPTGQPHGRGPVRARLRKWWARFVVLVLIAAAVYLGYRTTQNKQLAAAKIDLGTVTVTAQALPVEIPRTGQITEVDVQAQQQVKAGQRLGKAVVTTTSPTGAAIVTAVDITAPADGRVIDTPATVGTILQPGTPFAELYDPARLMFVAQVAARNLTELSAGMLARLDADGLSRPVKASVQRLVPRVGSGATDVKPGYLELILVPASAEDATGLVPGLRLTGAVDTRTGQPGRPRLVALGKPA
jgi:multidrug resistance efflux pump